MLGNATDPYYIAFTRGLLELVHYVQGDDRISIICDDDMETAPQCYMHYRGIRRAHEEVRQKTVALTFANDKYFPALQAADMLAYLARLEAKTRFYPGDRYSFRRLWCNLTDQRGPGFTQWSAMFADKQILQNVSDGLDKLARRREKN